MPLPAAAVAVGAKALPALAKIPASLKALYGSKYFLHALLGAGYGGTKLLEAAGQAGERGLTKEQIKLQSLIQKASAEATKLSVEESRKKTKEYIKALLKSKREDVKAARELASIQSFQQSQDRQMALIMQAVQALSQRQMGASTQAPGGGMLGLMRGGL